MKPKLLIADDDEAARMMLRELLSSYECDLLEAADGFEALSIMGREQPDLVLLDLAMPGLDGAQVLARAHADPGLRQIPVIMLTGHAERSSVIRIARWGVRDYLVKPFARELLLERVNRVVELTCKGNPSAPARRYDEPLVILLVDDKPAIYEQIKQGLADTAWQIQTQPQVPEAVAFCDQTVPDLVLASLTLSNEGAKTLLTALRAKGSTRKVPVLGLSVRTAAEQQRHALQHGFSGVVTKPIRFETLKTQICRALNLDRSSKYFERRQGTLLLRLPALASAECAEEALELLPAQAAAAVEAGVDRLVLDLSQVKQPGPGMVTLAQAVVRQCEDLELEHRIVAAEPVSAECRKASKKCNFAPTLDEALASLATPEVPAAGE